MTETERGARLLADTFGILSGSLAAKLNEAGLTVLPLEPDEATLRDIAKEIAATHVNKRERCVEPDDRAAWCADYAEDHWHEYVPEARAAYRAVVKGKK